MIEKIFVRLGSETKCHQNSICYTVRARFLRFQNYVGGIFSWNHFLHCKNFEEQKTCKKGSFGIFAILPKYVREGRLEIYQEKIPLSFLTKYADPCLGFSSSSKSSKIFEIFQAVLHPGACTGSVTKFFG